MISWLVVYLPLWRIWKSVGMMKFPIYGKKIVPNHQPDWDSLGYFWRIYQQHLGYLMILAGLPNLPFHEERDSDHGLHSPQWTRWWYNPRTNHQSILKFLGWPPPMTVRIPINVMPWSESSMIITGAHPQFLQGGAPKIAKLVYNSNNYGL